MQQVGRRLVSAQPREMAVGNVVRRVLGVIREEAEEDRQGETSEYSDTGTDTRPHSPGENDQCRSDPAAAVPRILNSSPLRQIDVHDDDELSLKAPEPRPPLSTSHASYMSTTNGPTVTSMFSLLSHPTSRVASPTATPRSISPSRPATLSDQALANITAAKDFRAEVVEGIQEILEEVNQADDQIAGYALEHIHSNEIILTYAYSTAVQKFLLRAALKRKFTVVHAEGFSNNHERVHAATIGKVKGEIESDEGLNPNLFQKSLAAAGITVILVPDSGIFALMSRVNKVILGSHTVLANGDLVATAGTKIVASAARMHRTPVVILSGVYKLSSIYPFNIDLMMEAGDPSKVIGYDEGELMDKVDIENPLFDLVPAELVDLYITNL